MKRPVIGISGCLLGLCVRYDGGCKPSTELVERLQRHFKLVPVCPEHDSGMPVPREPMDLYMSGGETRLITVNTSRDLTGILARWIDGFLETVSGSGFRGFVLKSGSPSCGVGNARIHRDGGLFEDGTGLFAAALVRRFPHLPVVQETDPDASGKLTSSINETGGLSAES